jgi:hypothetical protein
VSIDISPPIKAALNAFGQTYNLVRVRSGSGYMTFTGILEDGVEPEEVSPGEGSINTIMTALKSDFNPEPVKGDEIESATTVYKIIRKEIDVDGRMLLGLRYDRDIP